MTTITIVSSSMIYIVFEVICFTGTYESETYLKEKG